MDCIVMYCNEVTSESEPKNFSGTLISLCDSLNIDLYHPVNVEYFYAFLNEHARLCFTKCLVSELSIERMKNLYGEFLTKISKDTICNEYKLRFETFSKEVMCFLLGMFIMLHNYITIFPKIEIFADKWDDDKNRFNIIKLLEEDYSTFNTDFNNIFTDIDIVPFSEDYFDTDKRLIIDTTPDEVFSFIPEI